MTPVKFPQANVRLLPPAGVSEEDCGVLHAHRDGTHHISCWRPSFVERLRILFTGRVWLWVWSAHTQPPVCLEARSPFGGVRDGGWLKRWRLKREVAAAVRQALREGGR